MFRFSLSKELLQKIIKISCLIQLFNALMDYILWINASYLVPSWTIATIVSGYSILVLSYDKLIKERPSGQLKEQAPARLDIADRSKFKSQEYY